MNIRIYILFMVSMLTSSMFGQFIGKDNLSVSLFYLQKSELDSSKKYIDLAVLDVELASEAKTWYYRGYIYKNLYKEKERENTVSPLRLMSITAFEKMLTLNGKDAFLVNAKKIIKYEASTLYNDAVKMLDPQNYKLAESNFKLYKKVMLLVDTNMQLNPIDIEFKLALASMLNGAGDEGVKQDSLQVVEIKGLYSEVLEVDSNNATANYNLAILYYNEGADIINELDYDLDLMEFVRIQDLCINLFLKGLPYMKKSYDLEYKRKETLVGLSNIYYSLNDKEKSEFYKQELDGLEKED
jgi:hypothetical protein